MPPAPVPRQPDTAADAWFRKHGSLRMLQEVQRQAAPELTRVFGQTGLFLRPSESLAPTLSGNLLAEVISLHRRGAGLTGDFQCQDGQLPLTSSSLSLVYGLFVFESSPDPVGLLSELARLLKPEGVALLLTFNPASPSRLRWAFKGLNCINPAAFAGQVRSAGLEVQRRRDIGPIWSPADTMDLGPPRQDGLAARLRMASLVVARRRDMGVTPLRVTSPAMKFRPGMSAGLC